MFLGIITSMPFTYYFVIFFLGTYPWIIRSRQVQVPNPCFPRDGWLHSGLPEVPNLDTRPEKLSWVSHS